MPMDRPPVGNPRLPGIGPRPAPPPPPADRDPNREARYAGVPARRPNPDLSNLVYMGGAKRAIPPPPSVPDIQVLVGIAEGGSKPSFGCTWWVWQRWGRPLVFYFCGLFVGWLVWGAHG